MKPSQYALQYLLLWLRWVHYQPLLLLVVVVRGDWRSLTA
jgi:hypothetical protein